VILCSISMSVSGFFTVVDSRVIIAYQFSSVVYIVLAIFIVCLLLSYMWSTVDLLLLL